jgi:hypothetical protein
LFSVSSGEERGILGKHPKLGSWVESWKEYLERGQAHDEQQALLGPSHRATKPMQ